MLAPSFDACYTVSESRLAAAVVPAAWREGQDAADHKDVRMLHHIALGARDVAALATFYTRHFQLVELARHLDGEGALRSIWLELAPGAVLMVERTDVAARQVEGIGAGPFLLAFGAADQGERAARCEVLERAGYRIEAETGYTSYARDPEGNRIAISCYPLPREEL